MPGMVKLQDLICVIAILLSQVRLAFMVDDDATSAFRGGGRLIVMAAGVGDPFCFMALTRCFFIYGPFPRVNAGIGDYRHCVCICW